MASSVNLTKRDHHKSMYCILHKNHHKHYLNFNGCIADQPGWAFSNEPAHIPNQRAPFQTENLDPIKY